MFNLIKRFFAKKEAPKEEVKTNNLYEWFSSRTSIIFENLDSRIADITKKIDKEKEKTKNNLEILKNAKLQNPNIPFKAKQLMEGNREAYIKKTAVFLSQIIPEKDYKKLHDFCISFDSLLDSFGKSTLRQYYVLQEFFANESKDIANNIKNFDNLIKELKGIIEEQNIEMSEIVKVSEHAQMSKKQGFSEHSQKFLIFDESSIFDKFEKTKEKITSLQIQINQKKRLNDELDNLNSLNKQLIHSKQSIEKGMGELKMSQEYCSLLDIRKNKEQVEKEFSENKSLLANSFSVIEASLKKYARMVFEDEKLTNSYLENPIQALLNDGELKIVNTLEKVHNSIIERKIELKERKKEKTLREIEKLNKGFFDGIVQKHNKLKSRLDDINKSINESKAKKVLEEYERSLNRIESDINISEQRIKSTKKEIEKINIGEIKKELEREINHLLKANIAIC